MTSEERRVLLVIASGLESRPVDDAVPADDGDRAAQCRLPVGQRALARCTGVTRPLSEA